MSQSLNPNLYPKDGFMFIETDGVKIFGDTWAGVVQRVILYRKRNGYPPGNPPEEVIAQACARTPAICAPGNNDHASFLKNNASLKSRVIMWLNAAKAASGKQFVEDATSRERAGVCATCPYNKGLPGGCASCKAAVKILREEIIGNRFQDGRLNACEVLGEDIPTSVHMEMQAEERGELPANCWRKRTL
jgi:hypothetical protein